MRLKIFYSPEGFGNVGYDFPAANAAGVVDAANDGLSTDAATSKIAQLGQTVGRAGNPARLLENREIPGNGFTILIDGQTVANAALTFKHATGSDKIDQPQILFLDSLGNEIGRINAFERNSVFVGRGAGGSMTTGVNNTFFGAFVGSAITSCSNTIAIGVGPLDFSPGNNPNNCIVIGNDSGDNGGGANTFGDGNIILGNLTADRPFPVGISNILIGTGTNNSQGGAIGDHNIFIGHASNSTGVSNSVMIGFSTGTAPLVLSNVFIISDDTRNMIIGFPVIGLTDNGNRAQVNGNIFAAGGLKPAIRTTTTAAETFGALDHTIIADATAGNINVNIDPTTHVQTLGNLKKKDGSANTVTLTALSGSIFGLGAPAASLSIGAQGQNISFHCDGVNIFVL